MTDQSKWLCPQCHEPIGDDADFLHDPDCDEYLLGDEWACHCDQDKRHVVHLACSYQAFESQAKQRGHSFRPPFDELAKVPKLYATEKVKQSDRVVYLHYFIGACDWWVTETDGTDMAFGFVCLGDPELAEWGYFSLGELQDVAVTQQIVFNGVRVATGLVIVERDLWWMPRPIRELRIPGLTM